MPASYCAWPNMFQSTDEFQLRSRTEGIRPAMTSGNILAYSWPRSDRGGSPPSLPTLLYSLSPCRVSQIFLGRPLALHTCKQWQHTGTLDYGACITGVEQDRNLQACFSLPEVRRIQSSLECNLRSCGLSDMKPFLAVFLEAGNIRPGFDMQTC